MGIENTHKCWCSLDFWCTIILGVKLEHNNHGNYCFTAGFFPHLFSVYSLVDHIPEGTPVSVQTSSTLGVWLAKGQKVIRCVDPSG